MQYIDKSAQEAAATQIIDQLLTDCWDGESYKSADYDGLCRKEYRKPLVDIMLQEQHSLCCYCMKYLINDHKTTLEHIAPHHCSKGEFSEYISNEITSHVVHTDSFDYNVNDIPPEKYPHDIAYHNLIASCNSNLHCNHFRSDNRIRELIYDKTISSLVEYDSAGNAFSTTYFNELATLGISTDPELILFRKLWAAFSKYKPTAAEVEDEEIEEKILEMVGTGGDERLLADMFGNPSKKEDFKKYNWFFNYYK